MELAHHSHNAFDKFVDIVGVDALCAIAAEAPVWGAGDNAINAVVFHTAEQIQRFPIIILWERAVAKQRHDVLLCWVDSGNFDVECRLRCHFHRRRCLGRHACGHRSLAQFLTQIHECLIGKFVGANFVQSSKRQPKCH